MEKFSWEFRDGSYSRAFINTQRVFPSLGFSVQRITASSTWLSVSLLIYYLFKCSGTWEAWFLPLALAIFLYVTFSNLFWASVSHSVKLMAGMTR
jgi:hypothetical protein